MAKQWVEIGVQRGQDVRFYTGQVAGTLEQSIFDKGPDDFVRLDRVRWLECEADHQSSEWNSYEEEAHNDGDRESACELVVVRNESLPEQYDHHIFFKRCSIIMVTPIRPNATVWEDRRGSGGERSYSIPLDVPGSH